MHDKYITLDYLFEGKKKSWRKTKIKSNIEKSNMSVAGALAVNAFYLSVNLLH